MKNERFAELKKQVDDWTVSKDQKEKGLRDALEEAQQGLDTAEADSDRFMKAGVLKKYTEAELRKGFYDKRINMLTNQLNDLLENGFLSKAEAKRVIQEIKIEQQRLLKEQDEKLKNLANEIYCVVMDTTEQIREGNTILSNVNMNLRGVSFEDNPYLGVLNNMRAETIAENYQYSLTLPTVLRHSDNPRYSMFLGGVPFAK